MTTKFYYLDKIEKLHILSQIGCNRTYSITLISTQKKKIQPEGNKKKNDKKPFPD